MSGAFFASGGGMAVRGGAFGLGGCRPFVGSVLVGWWFPWVFRVGWLVVSVGVLARLVALSLSVPSWLVGCFGAVPSWLVECFGAVLSWLVCWGCHIVLVFRHIVSLFSWWCRVFFVSLHIDK